MTNMNEFVLKKYFCRICNKKHEIKLRKSVCYGHENYPFSYTILHGNLENLLTTIYIDKNMEIRGVDVHELTNNEIFSKGQVLSITKILVEEIEELRKENNELLKEINKLSNL